MAKYIATLQQQLHSFETGTRVDLIATVNPHERTQFDGALEHVGEDYVVVGGWLVQLSHVVAVRRSR